MTKSECKKKNGKKPSYIEFSIYLLYKKKKFSSSLLVSWKAKLYNFVLILQFLIFSSDKPFIT